MKPDRHCIFCGKAFPTDPTGMHPRRKFCSKRCQDREWRAIDKLERTSLFSAADLERIGEAA